MRHLWKTTSEPKTNENSMFLELKCIMSLICKLVPTFLFCNDDTQNKVPFRTPVLEVYVEGKVIDVLFIVNSKCAIKHAGNHLVCVS